MSTNIIEAIDKELEQLQRVRAILADTPDTVSSATASLPGKRRGRPAGSKNLDSSISPLRPKIKKRGRPVASGKSASVAQPGQAKRVMSAEGKAKIAAAQKKRWASAKRAAKKAAKEAAAVVVAKKSAKKTTAKKATAKKIAFKTTPATDTTVSVTTT